MAEKVTGFRIQMLGSDKLSKDIKSLEADIQKWSTQQRELNKELRKTPETSAKYAELSGKIANAKQATSQLRKEQRDLQKTFKDVQQAGNGQIDTMGKINARLRLLRKEINDTVIGSKRFKEIGKEIKSLENRQRDFNQTLGRGRTFVGEYAKGAIGAFKQIGATLGIAFGAQLVFSGLRKGVEITAEFEKSLDNLSAITGAVGGDLEFYKEQAIGLARDQRLATVGANEFVEALKLVGSARPELLENKEALTALTKEAIILSQASGQTLPESAQNLGNTLNFMRLEADQSARVINVLAAASQKGAKEIPFINDALSKFGGVAASAGISVETSVAAVETLGKVIPEAATAGTNLRNVIAILQIEADKAGRPFEGLVEELDRLGPEVNNVTKLNKVFGRENLLAIQTLIAQREELKGLETAITGTNTAYEQAATNTDNLTSNYERLQNTLSSLVLAEGSGFNDLLNDLVKTTISLVQGLSSLSSFISDNKEEIIALATGVAALKAQQTLAATSTNALTIATKAQAIAQRLLNTALKANPIGLIITAVTLLATGFVALYKRSETVRAGIAGLANVAKEVFSIIKETVGGFVGGFQKIINGDFKGGLKDIGTIIAKNNPYTIAFTQGERLAGAFSKGYADKIEEETPKLAGTVDQIISKNKELFGSIEDVTGVTKENTQATKDNTKEKNDNDAATKSLNDQIKDLKDQLDLQSLSGSLNNTVLETYVRLTNKAKDAQDLLSKSIENTTQKLAEQDFFAGGGQLETIATVAIGSASEDVVKKAQDDLKKIILPVVEQIKGESTTDKLDIADTVLGRQFGLSEQQQEQFRSAAKGAAINLASTINEVLFANRQKRIENEFETEIASIDALRESEFDSLENRKEKELEVANLTKEQKKEITKKFEQEKLQIETNFNKQREELQKEQARKERNIAATKAVVEAFLASARSLATPPGPPITIPLAALALGEGLAKAAAIRLQKFEKGGMIQGRRHSQGGTIIEAEGGEFVVNRNASRTFRPVLEKINKFQNGGVVRSSPIPSPSVPQSLINQVTGGGVDMDQLEARITNSVVRSIRQIPVVVSINDVNEGQKKVNIAKKASGF